MSQRDLVVKIDAIKNTGEVIAQTLREMIFEGKFKPCQQLKQDQIAEMFGVSRVPVRDALNMLINMRMAVNVPRRGVIVHPLSQKLIQELFDVRGILEGAAIKIVICNLNQGLLTALAQIIVEQKKALKHADTKKAVELDEEFHKTIYQVINNQTLEELIYANWMRVKQARCSSSMAVVEYGRNWIKNSIKRHEDLLAALKSKDELQASQIVVDNIESSFNEVITCLEEMGWLNQNGAG
jgi:DNA-binding GntR family transcriptional regulator